MAKQYVRPSVMMNVIQAIDKLRISPVVKSSMIDDFLTAINIKPRQVRPITRYQDASSIVGHEIALGLETEHQRILSEMQKSYTATIKSALRTIPVDSSTAATMTIVRR